MDRDHAVRYIVDLAASITRVIWFYWYYLFANFDPLLSTRKDGDRREDDNIEASNHSCSPIARSNIWLVHLLEPHERYPCREGI
jgi:hypothetical protein